MELEVSERVLIKINERVLNQDGVLIKVNERNNSDVIKDHARAHARARAEPYPCSATTALAVRPPAMPGGWDAVARAPMCVQRFRFARHGPARRRPAGLWFAGGRTRQPACSNYLLWLS